MFAVVILHFPVLAHPFFPAIDCVIISPSLIEALDFTCSILGPLGPILSISLSTIQPTLCRTSSTLFNVFFPLFVWPLNRLFLVGNLFPFCGGDTSANTRTRRRIFHRSFPSFLRANCNNAPLSRHVVPHDTKQHRTMSHPMPSPMRSGPRTVFRTSFNLLEAYSRRVPSLFTLFLNTQHPISHPFVPAITTN